MKKILFTACIIFIYAGSQAQNRKYVSHFSLFKQYYNPAFTGSDGSVVKSYYRNQWQGFDGAPRTFFASGEVNLADYRNSGKLAPENAPLTKTSIAHSVGLSVMHDTFGPFIENQIYMSYKSQVSLTQKVRLQLGAAITYHAQTLDGDNLSAVESSDPQMQKYLNHTDRSERVDINLGLALSGENFYAGYAMQNVTGQLTRNDDLFFGDDNRMHYLVQGGYRKAVSDQLGVVFNGLFRYDTQQKETIEGQVKGVFYNTAWLGLGYRNALAYNFNVGFRISQIKIGYAFEIPTGDAQMIGNGNEIMISYNLLKIVPSRLGRTLTVW